MSRTLSESVNAIEDLNSHIQRITHLYGYDDVNNTWYALDADTAGNLIVRNLIWNTDTLAWEAATGSLGAGGAVEVTNFPAILTDAQLRASDVKVSLDGESVTVTGPLTDSQLADLLAYLHTL